MTNINVTCQLYFILKKDFGELIIRLIGQSAFCSSRELT